MSLHIVEGVSFHLKPNRDVTEIIPPLRRHQRLEGGRTHLYICPLATQQETDKKNSIPQYLQLTIITFISVFLTLA